MTVVDDYAHHPREVAATIAAARGIVQTQAQQGRVLVVLQPHLFSRTRDFAGDFAAALDVADRAWVLPVYAAREDPDPTVDARTITSLATDTVTPWLTASSSASSSPPMLVPATCCSCSAPATSSR
ncbi:glutamate ligase domain-containing protein [Brachybacterium sp. Z12]|uniref:glutamate ligase domain-containing protein n=1 Tax=Brachybacterium sp. Z12 TaxID=2759167 RepID=UPI00223C4002|nr:cyanophycin synthetase [Brachybacterium sp. Z12]